jgi:hypothetical protein
MKKILLSVTLISAAFLGKSQEIVFNEIYPDPGSGNTEYIELYNTTGNTVNLDCYTIIAYYKENGGGAWVLNLPDIDIAPFGHVVFGSALPIKYKFSGSYNLSNAYSWNNTTWLSSNYGSLRNYTRSGNNLVYNSAATTTNDFIPISNGNDAAVAIMLWKGTGVLSNALFTNSDIPQGSSAVVSLNPLTSYPLFENEGDGDDCSNSATFTFSTISAPTVEVAAITQAPGTNNGYFRTRDGFCGQWDKSQNNGEFTPGTKNSNLPPINTSTAITIAAIPACGFDKDGNDAPTRTDWSNMSITISDISLLVATFRIYEDDGDGIFNVGDLLILSGTITTTSAYDPADFDVARTRGIHVQVITASGCIQVVKTISAECAPLPIVLQSFTAVRYRSNVVLKWVTAQEDNNREFDIQRKIGNGEWASIGFVASKAPYGNSSLPLDYELTDINTSKGISQYRLKQVDIDNQFSFSAIRSVRGEGQTGKIIVYPNPSSNGNVSVVFEDVNVVRNITLVDINGRIIKQWRGITNNNIQIENLNAGFYTVRIVNTETQEQVVEKIIVNKR